jgi:hypothetical protein
MLIFKSLPKQLWWNLTLLKKLRVVISSRKSIFLSMESQRIIYLICYKQPASGVDLVNTFAFWVSFDYCPHVYKIYSKCFTDLILQVKICVNYLYLHAFTMPSASHSPLFDNQNNIIDQYKFWNSWWWNFAHLMSVPLSLLSANIARFWVSRNNGGKRTELFFLHWVSVLTCREHKTFFRSE